jgi:hypothetical protein
LEDGADASIMLELAAASDAAQIHDHTFSDRERVEEEGVEQKLLHRGGGGSGPDGGRGGCV